MTETNTSPLQIVGRHLDDYTITDAGADAELAHLASSVGQHLMLVVKFHPEVPVRQDLGHRTIELQQFFFRHPVVSGCVNVGGGRHYGAARPSGAGM